MRHRCQKARPACEGCSAAVFAKVDVTFGDDLTGVGGKAAVRVTGKVCFWHKADMPAEEPEVGS